MCTTYVHHSEGKCIAQLPQDCVRVGVHMLAIFIDEEDKFLLSTIDEMYEWALATVYGLGEDQFLFGNCYGLVVPDQGKGAPPMLLATEHFLVKMYWLLHPFGRMPSHENAVDQLKELAETGVLLGLKLNAHRRIFSPEEQDRRDVMRSLQDEEGRRIPHPMLQVSLGSRMRAADELARLLGVVSLLDECSLPQHVLDIANREAASATPHDGVLTIGDNAFLMLVRNAARVFCDGNQRKLPYILIRVATGCGMKLAVMKQKHTVNPRTRYISEIILTHRLPGLMGDYLIN